MQQLAFSSGNLCTFCNTRTLQYFSDSMYFTL